MELVDATELSFVKFQNLDDVIDRYSYICREIEDVTYRFFDSKIENLIDRSGNIKLKSSIIKSKMPTNPMGRFVICFLNPYQYDRPSRPIVRKVNGFGPIRYLEIEYSESIENFVRPNIDDFVNSIEYCQKLFLQKYIDLYSKEKNILVQEIKNIIASACSQKERDVIISDCRISVTTPFKNNFRFYVSINQIKLFARILEEKKFEFSFDPVLAMTSFLYCNEHDFFYDKFSGNRDIFLQSYFSETELTSINLHLQKMEQIFNKSDKISCREICRFNDFSLQITSNPQHEIVLSDIISRCFRSISNKFEDNVRNFCDSSNSIDKKVREKLNVHFSRLVNFGSTQAVKIGSGALVDSLAGEVLKRMLGG